MSELAECCAVDLSVVSRHLGLLERAGLVASSKAGRTVSYIALCLELAATFRAIADAIEECTPEQGCCG